MTKPHTISWSSKDNTGITNQERPYEHDKTPLNIIRSLLKPGPRKSGESKHGKKKILMDTPEEMEIGNQRSEE